MILLPALWLFCLLVMVLIDYYMGSAAEFLNAWSVVQRLLGQPPSAGDSLVYSKVGAFGEALCVLGATFIVAALLTLALRRLGPT